MISLHPFQVDLVAKVGAAYARGCRAVVMQLGTGGGKTHTASHLIRASVAKGLRVVFAAHLDALIDDTADRLEAAGLDIGIVQASRPTNPTAPVQVCSLATLARRDTVPSGDFVILDECHRAVAPSVRAILERYPNAKLLGLTATPQRGDGKSLGDVFQGMEYGPSVRELTSAGYLVPADVIAPHAPEGTGLAMHPCDAYERFARGSRAIVFAANVAHAKELVAEFTAKGYSTELVVGDTAREVRRTVRARMAAGDLQVLVGVGVFVEGWNDPTIETVVLARGFTVCGSFLQAIGRGLRTSPETGKTKCTVIDLRGACFLHGLPDEDRRWSLTGRAVARTERLEAIRRCQQCLALFRPARTCPRCGAPITSTTKVARVLSRGDRLEHVSELPQNERDRRYLQTLLNVAMRRIGMPRPRALAWAAKKFEERFGRAPEVA